MSVKSLIDLPEIKSCWGEAPVPNKLLILMVADQESDQVDESQETKEDYSGQPVTSCLDITLFPILLFTQTFIFAAQIADFVIFTFCTVHFKTFSLSETL